MGIAKEFSIQHRRVYEFFNLLSSLGICSVMERGRLAWVGLGEVSNTLKQVYGEIEVASVNQNMQSLFKTTKSPTLGLIGLRFLGLYLYLGVDYLSMRRVAQLFHDGKSDLKSLERRMYLVLNFLEVIGLVERTKKMSEYRLTIDRSAIVEYAMNKKKQCTTSSYPHSVDSLLNRYNHSFLVQMYSARADLFKTVTNGRA
jgi:hypothetical protein